MAVSEWKWDQANPSVIHNASEIQENYSGHAWDAQTDYHYDSNGNMVKALVYFHATQAQVEAAYAALTNRGQVSNFNQRVWNDLMDKIAELQLDWYMPRDKSIAWSTAVQAHPQWAINTRSVAYVSDERELVIYKQDGSGEIEHTNVGRRLMAYKFLEAVQGFMLLPATWTWIWNTEGVTIEPGTRVKGSYILDLVRAINHWCGLTKLEFTGPTVPISDMAVVANIDFLEMLEIIYHGFEEFIIGAETRMSDSLLMEYEDYLADLEIRTAFDFLEAIPFICTMVFYMRESVNARVSDSQQFGCELNFDSSINVEIGFSNDLPFSAHMVFTTGQEIIQFRLDDSTQTGIQIDTEVAESVAIILSENLAFTVGIDFKIDESANVLLDDSLSLSTINMLFTFSMECASIDIEPVHFLPDATGQFEFTSSGELVLDHGQDIEATASFEIYEGICELILYVATKLYGLQALNQPDGSGYITQYDANRLLGSGDIELESESEVDLKLAYRLISNTNVIRWTDDGYTLFTYYCLRLSSAPTIRTPVEAPVRLGHADRITSNEPIEISNRATLQAGHEQIIDVYYQEIITDYRASLIQGFQLPVQSEDETHINSTSNLRTAEHVPIASTDVTNITSLAELYSRAPIQIDSTEIINIQIAARAYSRRSNKLITDAIITMAGNATLNAPRIANIHAEVNILSISEQANIIQRLADGLYGSGEFSFDGTATIDQIQAATFRASVEVFDIDGSATIVLLQGQNIAGQGSMQFTEDAVLSCSVQGDTLAITLEPYTAAYLDDFSVYDLEKNFRP